MDQGLNQIVGTANTATAASSAAASQSRILFMERLDRKVDEAGISSLRYPCPHDPLGRARGSRPNGRAPVPRRRASPSAASELSQEAQVVLEEHADLGDAVAHHGDALETHDEGEARDLLRVVAHGAEHL